MCVLVFELHGEKLTAPRLQFFEGSVTIDASDEGLPGEEARSAESDSRSARRPRTDCETKMTGLGKRKASGEIKEIAEGQEIYGRVK